MAERGPVAGVDRGRPRNPGNDTAILDAALDLLIERGAAGTSIEAVARSAGVAKLTVYRRWQSKEELLMAALEHGRNPDSEAPETGQTIEELVDFIAKTLGRPRFRALMARVIGASVDYPELVNTYTRRYLLPRLTSLTDTAQQAIDAGRFPAGTDPNAVQDILAASIAITLLSGETATADHIAHRLWTLLRHIGYREQSD